METRYQDIWPLYVHMGPRSAPQSSQTSCTSVSMVISETGRLIGSQNTTMHCQCLSLSSHLPGAPSLGLQWKHSARYLIQMSKKIRSDKIFFLYPPKYSGNKSRIIVFARFHPIKRSVHRNGRCCNMSARHGPAQTGRSRLAQVSSSQDSHLHKATLPKSLKHAHSRLQDDTAK